jgi:cytochrome P450
MNTPATTPTLPPMLPGAVPVLKHYPLFRKDTLNFWLNAGKHHPIVRVEIGPEKFWIITDADFLAHILQKRAKQYPRDRKIMANSRMNGPETMFNTDRYEEWFWRRRMLQPAFHRRQINTFADSMVAEALGLSAEWDDGTTLDIKTEMKTLTMRIIGRTMFSVDSIDTDLLQQSFHDTADYTSEQSTALIKLPLWLPTPKNQKVRNAVDARMGFMKRIVQERFAKGEGKDDFLDLLVGAHLEDSDRQFTVEELVGEMNGVVFAGHDTTATTLSWILYLLTQHPDVLAKIRQEIDAVLDGQTPTLDHLPQMPYTERVILETLRLYPPVYVTLREADEPDAFGGYEIPVGTRMVINIRGIQRSETHWDEPEQFDPDRFLPEQVKARHKHAFIPFITGSRKCMGDTFALMEMGLILPAFLQQWDFKYAGIHPPVAKAGFVMEAEGEMLLKVKKR